MDSKKKKILIIDDELVFREAMVNALTPCGYTCVTVDNPADGIMRLKRESFDLLLLDIMMDPFDGWDTLFHIRTLFNHRDIPIIIASAKTLNLDEVIRFGEYVAGFQSKPFVDSEFCEAIQEFFSWYDPLLANVEAAEKQGVPQDVCRRWRELYRQVRAITQMAEAAGSICIPDNSHTEEECISDRKKQIKAMIADKRRELQGLRIRYPVFSL